MVIHQSLNEVRNLIACILIDLGSISGASVCLITIIALPGVFIFVLLQIRIPCAFVDTSLEAQHRLALSLTRRCVESSR